MTLVFDPAATPVADRPDVRNPRRASEADVRKRRLDLALSRAASATVAADGTSRNHEAPNKHRCAKGPEAHPARTADRGHDRRGEPRRVCAGDRLGRDRAGRDLEADVL